MEPKQIIENAIEEWNPSQIICLYSGGNDSLVMTHLVHTFDLPLPVYVYSIDTLLSADGWRDYVCSVADKFGWIHDIYTNKKGFEEFVEWVGNNGCPYTEVGHERVYNRLKDRVIFDILRDHKMHRPDKPKRWQHKKFDKLLFLSGIRKYESRKRMELENPIQRRGLSSAIFANPIFYWKDSDVIKYKVDYNLPQNPFYDTIGGSGDCQCNWGNFIEVEDVKKHSPNLYKKIKYINELSLLRKGWGYDTRPDVDGKIDEEEIKNLVSPFLCQNCSRSKKKLTEAEMNVVFNRMFE